MLKSRPKIKEEARALIKANPVLSRQMFVYRLLGLIFSTVLAVMLGNPVMEQINTVVELVQSSGYTYSQQLLVLQRMFLSVAGRLSILMLAQMVWNMFFVNLRFGVLTSIRKVAAGEGSAQMSDLTSGFPLFGRVVWLDFLVSLFILLRSLLFALFMGILVTALSFVGGYWMSSISLMLASIAFMIFVFLTAYRYILAEYILAENPAFTARQAIREAVACSKKRIGLFFGFDLSFLGWALLFAGVDYALGKLLGIFLPEIGSYISTFIMLPALVWVNTYISTGFTLLFRNLVGLDRPQEAPPAPPPYSGGTGGTYSGPDIQI